MDAFIASFSLIGLAELGDKTQLLALMLAAKYRKPVPILLGIAACSVVNFGIAAWLGAKVGNALSPSLMHWAVGLSMIAIGLWEFRPEGKEKPHKIKNHGAFVATVIAFFIGEFGDKTQFAALALGTHYNQTLQVMLGAVLAMVLANALPVLLGHAVMKRLPVKTVRRGAAAIFIAFGLWTIGSMMIH